MKKILWRDLQLSAPTVALRVAANRGEIFALSDLRSDGYDQHLLPLMPPGLTDLCEVSSTGIDETQMVTPEDALVHEAICNNTCKHDWKYKTIICKQ